MRSVPDYYVGGTIPWLKTGEVKKAFVFHTEEFITERGLESSSAKLIPTNSLIIAMYGDGDTAGHVAINKIALTTNQACCNFVVNGSKADYRYLYYYLKGSYSNLVALKVGGSQQNLNAHTLRRFPIAIPSLAIQGKIAAILSAYDDLIANNQRRIALLESMAEEIYREWFVRMRFPGHERALIERGLPSGWEVTPTKDAFEFFGGATPSKDVPRYWDGGDVNWYTPTDITAAAGMFLERSKDQCSDEGLQSCSARMFPSHSLMLTSRATIGAIGINVTPACTNQGFISCIPNERYPLTFLYHWLKLAKPHFDLLAGGSTFPELNKGTFKRIEVLTPPSALVQSFDAIVSPQFQTIELLLRSNAKLKSTRDALLPRLVSGTLKVDHLDIQLPPAMRETVTA